VVQFCLATAVLLHAVSRLGVLPYIRYYHQVGLEQLPQLFNVLNGTMSFVGPQPIIDGERLGRRRQAYFASRPGITGLWNITDVHHPRLDADQRYADECSPWFDLVILAKSLVTISD
jgi:exopolysaccharide production protein ExoY